VRCDSGIRRDQDAIAGTEKIDPKLKFKPSSPNAWYLTRSGKKEMMRTDDAGCRIALIH
jgi:hypothetical protein